jgi:hypothetical protein
MNIDYTQDSLTLTNTCPECIAQEQLCTDCVDTADAKLTDKAYDLVDEGNMKYKRNWMRPNEAVSGHDWVGSVTRVKPYFVFATQTWEDTRNEFTDPTVQLQDGGVYEELWELDDQRQRARETECPWCHLMTRKDMNDCQDCDRPLESNVR